MKAVKPFVCVSCSNGVGALAGPSIYVVDEAEGQAELYTLFLKGTGCIVRAFNDRAEALVALMKDRTRPDLLITDYLGESMPIDRFLQYCLVVHPSLRILMATELGQKDVRASCVRPDRFIQKPFTADEFLQEVRAALEYSNVPGRSVYLREVFNRIHVA